MKKNTGPSTTIATIHQDFINAGGSLQQLSEALKETVISCKLAMPFAGILSDEQLKIIKSQCEPITQLGNAIAMHKDNLSLSGFALLGEKLIAFNNKKKQPKGKIKVS